MRLPYIHDGSPGISEAVRIATDYRGVLDAERFTTEEAMNSLMRRFRQNHPWPSSAYAIVFAVVATFTVARLVHADQLVLSDGRIINGIVIQESDSSIRFKIGSSTVTFPRSRIKSVSKATTPENKATTDPNHGAAIRSPFTGNERPSSPEKTENPRWPGLGLPADFMGTRVGITINPDDYDPANFDLEKEVARIEREVQQGKGVPPVLDTLNPYHVLWKDREIYEPIISAAREARLSHGNPYLGESTDLPEAETIHVPGNITGKDDLLVRYVRGGMWKGQDLNNQDHIWGDDEDIIYLVGSLFPKNLMIHPGTIMLAAHHQDDSAGGAMTPDMIHKLEEAYFISNGPEGPCRELLHKADYGSRLSRVSNFDYLIAKGRKNAPILIDSDVSITPSRSSELEFTQGSPHGNGGFEFTHGIADYVFSENGNVFSCQADMSIISRSHIVNNLDATFLSEYFLANFFGNNYQGSEMGSNDKQIVKYNLFSNKYGPVGIGYPRSRYILFVNNTIRLFTKTSGCVEMRFLRDGDHL